MIPLLLIGALVLGACMVFGYSSFVVGFVLMASGLLGLIAFMGTRGTVQRLGEHGTVIEERHYIGDAEEHERRHHRL